MDDGSKEGEVTAFLSDPASYAERPPDVEVIETHAARVFLAGSKAFKVKKRVRLPFLDFSTLALRHQALARELALNQPHAPEIYLRLVAVTRRDGGRLAFGGDGAIVEWGLEMQRFPQSSLLACMADRGALSQTICKDLAAMVARYHRTSPIATGVNGPQIVAGLLNQLESEFAGATSIVGGAAAATFQDLGEAALKRTSRLLDARGRAGAIRRCHGDLHLGNIVMLHGHPVAFDALEFDDALATIDVLYDLAFLLMDLETRGDRRGANVAFNAYVAAAPVGHEIEGLACLPLFLACRAAVRALVAIEQSRQQAPEKRETHERQARRLLAVANRFLAPPAPSLVAVGGLSGTGKSTLAAGLAPRIGSSPGALHLRSDVERKRLFGVEETKPLAPEHYTEAVSDKVYRILLHKAEQSLAAGHAAVIDAVFAKPREREDVAALAAEKRVPFAGLWLMAPLDTLIARVGDRRGDASDANAEVVEAQAGRDVGPLSWARIDAGGGPAATLAEAEAALPRLGIEVTG